MSVDIANDAKRANDEIATILDKYNQNITINSLEINSGKVEKLPTPSEITIESLTEFMDSLEKNMELKRGITITVESNALAHIGADPTKKSDVIIRDARSQTPEKAALKPEDTEESWVISAAARTRGALKLIGMARGASANPEKAVGDACKILKGYRTNLETATDPKERHSIINGMDYELTYVLKNNGLKINGVDLNKASEKSVEKMLMDARDACNFEKANHPSIVTITSNLAPDGSGKTVNQVIAAIPTTPCTDQNKSAYFGHTMTSDQPWYKALTQSSKDEDKVRAALAIKYQYKIADGQHVTPTQLRWLPGTANTYVQDVSYIIDGKHDKNRGFVALRTAVPLHGRGDNDNIGMLTSDNIKHINSIAHTGKYVGLNSDLDTEVGTMAAAFKLAFGQKEEQAITNGMRDALKGQFESCPISVTTKNKAVALKKAADILLEGDSTNSTFYDLSIKERITKFQQISTVFCKSGKDRTQAALEEAGLKDAHQVVAEVLNEAEIILSEEQKKNISLGVKEACHGEAMSGGNGSSRGSFGTKISNVYGKEGIGPLGMPLKEALILDIKDIAKSEISEITKVEGKDPKEPVLESLKKNYAVDSMKEVRHALVEPGTKTNDRTIQAAVAEVVNDLAKPPKTNEDRRKEMNARSNPRRRYEGTQGITGL
jgi:hypothetical protein